MKRQRVAVTGLGVVAATGNHREEFWSSLVAGRHGFREISLCDTSDLQFHLGGEVQGVDLESSFSGSSGELLDRFARLFVVAAREAVSDSGLGPEDLRDAAVVTGSSLGGQTTQDDLFRALYAEGRRRLTPFAVPRIMSNSGASAVSMELGVEGPGLTLSTACASSTHALGLAYWMISRGMVARAVAGGSDAPFSRGHLKAWDSLRAVSSELCRPFSKGRKGLLLAEGGASLVLESEESARSRGARVHAWLLGFGMSSDASHATKPVARGAARAMRTALEDAALEPEKVGYINAHGTGTPLNDAVESEAIQEVFGEHAHRLMLSSTKSMHGHALGASGAIEAVATSLALERRTIPPTANYLEVDPACPLDCVPNEAREAAVDFALSSSFAFGGLNGVLVFAAA